MSQVSKFIQINNAEETEQVNGLNGGVKETSGDDENKQNSSFKVSSANLPAKQSGFFAKLKNILCYEIKVELTPYEQKIEDEINEFLHQEVTWGKVKDFLFTEVTFGKKK